MKNQIKAISALVEVYPEVFEPSFLKEWGSKTTEQERIEIYRDIEVIEIFNPKGIRLIAELLEDYVKKTLAS